MPKNENQTRDSVLRRMLKTPPTKHAPLGKKPLALKSQEEIKKTVEQKKK